MGWWKRTAEALATLLRKERVERELDDELAFHVEQEAAKLLRQGAEPEDARREALRRFGGLERTKEQVRDERGVRALEDLIQDVRYGLRTLAHNPGYTLVVLMTLGLGIGANTAIFSVVSGVLLDPLPYEDGEELVYLRQSVDAGDIAFSVLDIQDLREGTHAFEEMVEYHGMTFTLLGEGDPEEVATGVVSHNFFRALGTAPILGRDFSEADDDLGAEAVLVLSHGYWLRRFGGDPSVVGRTFEMNGKTHTVIGVLPPVPQFPADNDVYMPTSACPIRSSDGFRETRNARMMAVFGRMADGVEVETAAADVAAAAGRLRQTWPTDYPAERGHRVTTSRLKDELVHGARPTLLVLLGTAGFVLLIACANVANLALARMTRREQELAVRSAMGAGRG
ncbi:MAG: ABC transporter permease, partial [Gemmatimonadetes bacterium]|nr:ABC transporter permease [Gemmatimonadota bacterium]